MTRYFLRTLFTLGAGLVASAPLYAQTSVTKVTSPFSNIVGLEIDASALTVYSGHVGSSSDGTIFLQQSAMARPVSSTANVGENSEEILQNIRELLQPESSPTGAFRYKVLLYQPDPEKVNFKGDKTTIIRANFENIEEWYSDPERQLVEEAIATLREAIVADPFNADLHLAMLDIYYDRAVAEIQHIKNQLMELNELVLDLSDANTDSDGSVELEIDLWNRPNGILDRYRMILGDYGELFAQNYGIRVSDFDPSFSRRTPMGYYLFNQNVPDIAALAARYINEEGALEYVPVNNPNPGYPVLYNGYRDLVLILGLMGDYASGLAETALLLHSLSNPNDSNDPRRVQAEELIREGLQSAYLDGRLLVAMFGGLEAAKVDNSGLQAAIDSWEVGVQRLTSTRRILDGNLNPLGFHPDFLVLTTGFQSQGNQFFDSYNTLANWITEISDPPVRPLSIANAEFQRARTELDNYRGYQDQLDSEFFEIKLRRDEIMIELIGSLPGEPAYNPRNPQGGLLAEQRIAVEIAQAKIRQIRAEQDNVIKSVNIEVERRGIEAGISNAISSLQMEYGEKRVSAQQEIGTWRAAQATAQATSDALGNVLEAAALGPVAAPMMIYSAVVGTINAGVQAGGEAAIAQQQAQIERFNAYEASKITSLEDDLLDANSEALIKNLYLQLATLGIEMTQAELTLRQEFAKLANIYETLARTEATYNDEVQFASQRYFADPIHLLRKQESKQRAEDSFREAQNWIFFTARALEYKWNTTFSRTVGQRTWSINELFKTRNTRELNEMLAAMEIYDGAQSFGPGTGTNTDSLSLREDILGWRDVDSHGQPLLYQDPISGDFVRSREAFRSYLKSRTNIRDNGDEVVSINFSTVLSPPGTQFFLPPQFDNQGNAVELGTWLNKIQWIKINVPGDLPQGGFLNGFLSDGGSQLIRRSTVGTLDPNQPDFVRNDTTAYSSRIWFTQDGGQTFEFRERLRAPIRMERGHPAGTTTLPDVPENTFFRERSVANTGWTLDFTIFSAGSGPGGTRLLDLDNVDDIEIIINHRFTPRL